MTNPYGPGCTHIKWAEGQAYATFRADSKSQYAKAKADREVETMNQSLVFDGEPHACGDCGDNVFVVALKGAK